MVLTTKVASYIIVLGIVISVLPISSILLQDGYHVRFKQNSKQRRRGAKQTLCISLKQTCPIDLLSNGIPDAFSSSNAIPAIISECTEAISEAIPNSKPEAISEAISESIPEANSDHCHHCTLLQEGELRQWLCEAVGEHLSSRYVGQVHLSLSSHICSKIVLGRNVCNCSSEVDSALDARDQ